MKCRFILALVFVHTSLFCSPSKQQGPVLLISAQRSGTNWSLACLQFLTRRYLSHLLSYPALCETSFTQQYNRLDLQLERRKPYLFRTHDLPTNHKLLPKIKKIMILRNYREVALRYCKFNPDGFNKIAAKGAKMISYITLLQRFDALPDKDKMLFYYEDLIQDPRRTLSSILNFINEPCTRMDEFMENIAVLKKRCADSYYNQMSNIGGPISRGSSISYHSDQSSPEILEKIDAIVKKLAGDHIWDKYLKHYNTHQP
ncbi:MAG: sulfotransferase domain-containing protein [Chlamydiia bacterium]|nr:sulfotransferase domain-containing protein [Chlamydiia bacterium]